MGKAERLEALELQGGAFRDAVSRVGRRVDNVAQRVDNLWTTLNQVIGRLDTIDQRLKEYDKHWPAAAPAPAPTMEPPGFRKLWPVAITNCRCDWYRQFDTTWKVDPDVGCLVHSPK